MRWPALATAGRPPPVESCSALGPPFACTPQPPVAARPSCVSSRPLQFIRRFQALGLDAGPNRLPRTVAETLFLSASFMRLTCPPPPGGRCRRQLSLRTCLLDVFMICLIRFTVASVQPPLVTPRHTELNERLQAWTARGQQSRLCEREHRAGGSLCIELFRAGTGGPCMVAMQQNSRLVWRAAPRS